MRTSCVPDFDGLDRYFRPGEYRLPCPECAKGKPRRNDKALKLSVDQDGTAVWFCHRCHWTGSTRSRGTVAPPQPPAWRAPENGGLNDYGQHLWRACHAITPESPAARYLTSRRCVVPPGDLKWHPSLKHAPSGQFWPALVALVTDAVTGKPISLHRIYLAQDGSGKAPVEPPRMLLKGHRKAGGVVRLSPDCDVSMGLVIAEGIETALSALAAGHGPVWATLDADNLAAFPVLSGIEALTVLVDNDEAGLAAFGAVAGRWSAAQREVLRFLPERGDANDWWREVA